MSGSEMRTVAVVGSGVPGLTAAFVLGRDRDVTLFESDDRFGGHAHTHRVEGHAVDLGFVVHNDRTHPLLRRLFAELDVEVHPTEMSMSIHCDGCGLEYAGGRTLAEHTGLAVTQRRPLGRHYARTLRMWRDRFDANWPAINARGFGETFCRMWELDLGYGEAGLTTGHLDVVQLQMQRPAEAVVR